jgi:hypothetical protein
MLVHFTKVDNLEAHSKFKWNWDKQEIPRQFLKSSHQSNPRVTIKMVTLKYLCVGVYECVVLCCVK